MSKKHHWVGEVDPDTYYGFVYLITNTVTDRKYIGRKFYHTYRKRKRFKESNWRVYAGSCKPLKEDMQRMGKDKFTFEIICNYKTRGGVVSGEVHFQTDNDVLSPELLPCGERLYYNGQIGAVKFISPEFYSAESRAKMSASHKGKTFSAEHRAAISASHTGEKNGFYGKSHSAATKAKIGDCSSKGPYLMTFKDGHTEKWDTMVRDGYDIRNIYSVFKGKRKTHKDIIKVERIGSDD